jgi:hypothetical protein
LIDICGVFTDKQEKKKKKKKKKMQPPHLSVPNLSASVDGANKSGSLRNMLTQSLDPAVLTPNTIRKNPNLLRVKEFGHMSPNSPNLTRRLDPAIKQEVLRQSALVEEQEKKIRALEANSALAPARGKGGAQKLKWAFNADKTVVSLPIKVPSCVTDPGSKLRTVS